MCLCVRVVCGVCVCIYIYEIIYTCVCVYVYMCERLNPCNVCNTAGEHLQLVGGAS